MKLGIVGHEAAKFTPDTYRMAFCEIGKAIEHYGATVVVSGGCHLGGIDIWAEEVAQKLGVPTIIHKPTRRQWSGPGGFKERNLAIARDSDLVLCIVVRELPPDYHGAKFTFTNCYHCLDRNPPHVKSGGCFTAWSCPRHDWRIIG